MRRSPAAAPSPGPFPAFGRAVKAPVPPVHRHAAHLARRLQQICLGVLAEVLEPEGLTGLQYAAIVSVDEVPGIDQRRLADRIGIDPVSAHHLIDGLDAAGIVERRVAPEDRRVRLLRLTARGAGLRRRLRPAMMATQDRILAPLAPKERAIFMAQLTRIVEGNESYARPGNGRRPPGTRSIPSD